MSASKRSSASVTLAAVGFSLGFGAAAQADVVLPVQNLQFNQLTNPLTQDKDFFGTVSPTYWSTGTAGAGGALTYVGQQGSEGFTGTGGNIYPVYTTPGFSVTVPAGTNFFQADGNPQYEDTIFQTIHGLIAGVTYDLQFQQAAGQQVGYDMQTTEQWKVFLGVGNIGTDCTTNPCTVTGTANNEESDSPTMTTPAEQDIDWNSVNLTFKLNANEIDSSGNAILTFLAWGDSGSTTNEPPTVFLEGVNTTPIPAPEPATLSLLGASILGFAGLARRRRGKRDQAD